MATTNDALTTKISSTVSSPTVNYSATYTASRSRTSDKNVSVTVQFKTWLNSSGSRLGTGIKLTAFVRVGGGAWHSVVLKSTSASWSGTSQHSAFVTFDAAVGANSAAVEWYVSRAGSTVGGTAGTLGIKKYTAAFPAYAGAMPTPTDVTKYVYSNVGGVWERAVPYVKTGGAWEQAAPYVKSSGVWKEVS